MWLLKFSRLLAVNRSSKSLGVIRVKFLYCPLTAWNFKPANKVVPLYTDLFLYNSVFHPLYTDLFLYNSVCHQRLSLRFLLLDKMWFTSMKAALATCKDIFPTRSSELVDQSARLVRRNARRIVRTYTSGRAEPPALSVTLLRCGRMLKSGPGLICTFLHSCEHI
jgi:hypothetical protein